MINIFGNTRNIFVIEDKYIEPAKKYIGDSKLLYRLDWDDRTSELILQTELLEYRDLLFLHTIGIDVVVFIGIYRNLPQVLNYFEENKYLAKPNMTMKEYNSISTCEIGQECARYEEALKYLAGLNIIGKDQKNFTEIRYSTILYKYGTSFIKYICDIPNYVSILYGEETMLLASDWIDMTEPQKDFIKEFYKQPSRETKIQYLQDNLLSAIGGPDIYYQFLPEWYKINLHVFGLRKPDGGETRREDIEWKMADKTLDYEEQVKEERMKEELKNQIYETFNLRFTYTGDQIKETMEDIYKSLSIPPTNNGKSGKLGDIEKYFEIKKVRGGYRLVTRKLK